MSQQKPPQQQPKRTSVTDIFSGSQRKGVHSGHTPGSNLTSLYQSNAMGLPKPGSSDGAPSLQGKSDEPKPNPQKPNSNSNTNDPMDTITLAVKKSIYIVFSLKT